MKTMKPESLGAMLFAGILLVGHGAVADDAGAGSTGAKCIECAKNNINVTVPKGSIPEVGAVDQPAVGGKCAKDLVADEQGICRAKAAE